MFSDPYKELITHGAIWDRVCFYQWSSLYTVPWCREFISINIWPQSTCGTHSFVSIDPLICEFPQCPQCSQSSCCTWRSWYHTQPHLSLLPLLLLSCFQQHITALHWTAAVYSLVDSCRVAGTENEISWSFSPWPKKEDTMNVRMPDNILYNDSL